MVRYSVWWSYCQQVGCAYHAMVVLIEFIGSSNSREFPFSDEPASAALIGRNVIPVDQWWFPVVLKYHTYFWYYNNWRARHYQVTQLKIRDICLLYVWTYVCHFCTLTLAFCVSTATDPVPNFTKQNPPVYRSLPVPS